MKNMMLCMIERLLRIKAILNRILVFKKVVSGLLVLLRRLSQKRMEGIVKKILVKAKKKRK